MSAAHTTMRRSAFAPLFVDEPEMTRNGVTSTDGRYPPGGAGGAGTTVGTPGQFTFFTPIVVHGWTQRYEADLAYYSGPFWFQSEYGWARQTRDGVLATTRGRGTFVANPPPPLDPIRHDLEIDALAAQTIAAARAAALDPADLPRAILAKLEHMP